MSRRARIRILAYLLFFLCAAQAHGQTDNKLNTLSAEDAAQGKVLLFDGKTTNGWIIDGDSEVKDGVLILGGNRNTIVRIPDDMSPNFLLHLEYSFATNQPIYLEIATRTWLGRGISKSALTPFSDKSGQWFEAIYSGKEGVGSSPWSVWCQSRMVGEPAFQEAERNGARIPDRVYFTFEIPAGQKLYLRNVRVKTDPVHFWLWLALLVVGSLALLLILVGLWYVVRKKRSAAPV